MANPKKKSALTRLGESIAIWLGTGYINLCYATGRYEHLNEDEARRHWDEKTPFIGAFWHNRLLLIVKGWRSAGKVYTLISRHGDGELITRIMHKMNVDVIRGSSASMHKRKKDRGGSQAFLEMVSVLKDGATMSLTPDGPKGPRYRAKEGIVLLAKYSGAPILPVAYSAKWAIVLNSWDRFMVPLPFSKGVILWGAPIQVPTDADDDTLEAKRLEFENEMIRVAQEADRMMGRTPIEPAPPRVRGSQRPPEQAAEGPDVRQTA